MPKVRRRNLPRALYTHLLDAHPRTGNSSAQLILNLQWLDTEPEVPEGRWFKRFSEMSVCGEGEWGKTFLRSDQTATGTELP